jgi:hypothetical protein
MVHKVPLGTVHKTGLAIRPLGRPWERSMRLGERLARGSD